jgi:hypothetical protein
MHVPFQAKLVVPKAFSKKNELIAAGVLFEQWGCFGRCSRGGTNRTL